MAVKTNWTPLNWEDPFELDSQLNDEQRMVRDSARQYAQDRLLPRVKEAFRSGSGSGGSGAGRMNRSPAANEGALVAASARVYSSC